MAVHSGSCHCGAVRFEFDRPPGPAFQCNCTLCHRRGAVWQGCEDAHFRLLKGQQALSRYTFGTHTAQHFFCRHCGVGAFSHPRLAPQHWVVNLRCVDGIDWDTLQIGHFDGQHWEAAARDFLRARQGQRASA